MHSKILKDLNEIQLRKFAKESLDYIKIYNPEMYEEIEHKLYLEAYGHHFNEWLLECALQGMINEDGTKGGHWTVEQTNSVARSKGLTFSEYNEYDFNYVMNMIYSDYYGVIRDDIDTYYNMSIKFLTDKDFSKGKAYYYYMMVKENT